jgi:hypothetical protein
MAELILRDTNGQEVCRRPMEPQERYDLYARCRDRECLEHAGLRYTLITVAYDRAAEQCLCQVRCEGYGSAAYCDD